MYFKSIRFTAKLAKRAKSAEIREMNIKTGKKIVPTTPIG
jgi:hypothetical protein